MDNLGHTTRASGLRSRRPERARFTSRPTAPSSISSKRLRQVEGHVAQGR
ncbi:hypothetical protein HMPREF9946_01719 [Acetobacteraceae bacterium AT-5844]|nr:hypothetical protein HMPREF9946_01719 [Acetobacteraceae bacterium AT-5844]